MTTILAVKKDNQVAIAGDGQVTMGENVIMKHSAKKVRTLYHGKVVTGFAGSVSAPQPSTMLSRSPRCGLSSSHVPELTTLVGGRS